MMRASSSSSSSSAAAALPSPKMPQLRPDVGHGRSTCTLANVHVSVANAMRRTLLARLPVIGIPFEPYAKNQVIVTANTTDDTDQSIGYRIGNTPVHSLDPALVTDYAVAIDVINDRGNEIRVVTTEDMQLVERRTDVVDADDSAAPGSSSSNKRRRTARAFGEGGGDDVRKPEVRRVFPPSADSGDYIALAELAPPAGALQLRATFAWVDGTGAFAPNVVAYQNTPDVPAAAAAWAKKELEIRAAYARDAAEIAADNAAGKQLPEMRYSEETTVAHAKHDFELTGAKMHFLEHSFDFTYEMINTAYTFRRAWRQAATILVEQLQDILASIDANTLEVWPAGTAASHGRTSVTANSVIGGFGFDAILPGVDHTLGPAVSHALISLCFVRNRAEAVDSDRLVFCAFHQFTPDDEYGVIRLALTVDERTLVPHHLKTACNALVTIFTQVGELLRE